MKMNGNENPSDVDDVLFDVLSEPGPNNTKVVSISKFWSAVQCTGVIPNDPMADPRLAEIREAIASAQKEQGLVPDPSVDIKVDRDTFKDLISDNIFMVGKIFRNDLIIPEFQVFTDDLERIYKACQSNQKGQTSKLIPQLERANPDNWGVSVCTIDGQRASFGNSKVPFTTQELCKPLNYAIAVTDMGATKVHRYVGQEPSGRGSDSLSLDDNNKPHNPMINAGGIIITSLLKTKLNTADRYDYVLNEYKKASGGEYLGFNNASNLSARNASDRDYALAFYMRENKCFVDGKSMEKNLDFYFQLCSTEITVESGAVMAATLANGGICPITGERVFTGEAVRDTLSLMYSCGLYDHSGQFAFRVGLPAKSGQSGAIMLVVPNVLGICTWSPPIDNNGNSCRGLQFCEDFIKQFNFHNYDNLKLVVQKKDPRALKYVADDIGTSSIASLLFGAAQGDTNTIRRFALSGMDLGRADYDQRTALHLAASEGHLAVVKLLLEKCHVYHEPRDRYNHSPLDEARKNKHGEVVKYLENYSPQKALKG